MSASSPLYYIGPPGPACDTCRAVDPEVRVFGNAAAFLGAAQEEPGLVVLSVADAAEALALAGRLGDAGPGWVLALATPGDPPAFRTLSLGVASGAEDVAAHLREAPLGKTTLVDLREALGQIQRARHDLNNPLTAALAEVQVLLMDAEDSGADPEALLAVQAQLRRIRDLLIDTNHLRLPAT